MLSHPVTFRHIHGVLSFRDWAGRAAYSPGYVLLFISNYRQLHEAYGQQLFCDALLANFEQRLKPYGIVRTDIVVLDQLVLLSLAGVSRKSIIKKNQFVEWIKAVLCHAPIKCGVFQVQCNVRGTWLEKPDEAVLANSEKWLSGIKQAARSIAFADAASQPPKKTRSDMQRALCFFKAMRDHVIALSFQPVFSVRDRQALYYDTRLRLLTHDGKKNVSCTDSVRTLERIHLIERLDCSVLWSVIETLDRYPGLCLAFHVSVLSLQGQGWWKCVLVVLEKKPDLAARLVVAITGVMTVFDREAVVCLLNSLRQCGCQIAMEESGNGQNAPYPGWQLQPDLIRISKSMVRQVHKPHADQFFQARVKAARKIGKYVVVEGIESESDLQRCATMEIHGVRGGFVEKACIQPYWLAEPVYIQDRFNSVYFS